MPTPDVLLPGQDPGDLGSGAGGGLFDLEDPFTLAQ